MGWDLLLDFDVPIASFGMSTMMSRFYTNNVSDRMRLFDGPLGTGNLVAEVFSQGNPSDPYWHAVRFTGHDAGSPVIRSVVIDVQSDVDTRLFLDGLAFGPAQPATSAAGQAPQAALRLHPAAPNPFNPRTTIRYDLASAGHVQLGLFDLRGRLVRQLADGERPAGAHAVLLDGGDLASGIYLLRLVGPGGLSATQRVTLVR
ncbi:MAG: T9SS type A sorting domain-containing protein [bacterium]|nr:T9SS type A sorting domain-containing protein [bacterium]